MTRPSDYTLFYSHDDFLLCTLWYCCSQIQYYCTDFDGWSELGRQLHLCVLDHLLRSVQYLLTIPCKLQDKERLCDEDM